MKYRLVPIGLQRRLLRVATAEANNLRLLDEVALITGDVISAANDLVATSGWNREDIIEWAAPAAEGFELQSELEFLQDLSKP